MTDRQDELVRAAAEARQTAYSPYSRFRVGAAVLTSTGRIYAGCNVENVSYGLTVCAERVAVWKAVSEGEREIEAVAVVVEGSPAFPCGACLQVIQQFAAESGTTIIAAATDGRTERRQLSECLPYPFSSFDPEGRAGPSDDDSAKHPA